MNPSVFIIILIVVGQIIPWDCQAREPVIDEPGEASTQTPVKPQPSPQPLPQQEQSETAPEVSLEFLDTPHSFISNNIEWISRRLDKFFSNDNIYEESTGSYIRVRQDVFLKKGGELLFDTSVRSKIELPKTKQKLQFLIRNESEENEDSATSSFTESVGDNDYSTSLRRLLKVTEHINTHIDAGVKLRSSLDSFVRMRARVKTDFAGAELNFVEAVSWFDSEGWRSSTVLEYRQKLFQKSLVRMSSQLLVGNRLPNASFVQAFGVYNGEHSNTFYMELSALLTDKPNVQDSAYVAKVVYKTGIHKDWLYLTMGPQLDFRRETGFRTEPGFLMQLEANFGEAYGKPL